MEKSSREKQNARPPGRASILHFGGGRRYTEKGKEPAAPVRHEGREKLLMDAGKRIAPFGVIHLAYIAFFLAASVLYALHYKRLAARRRETADRVLGALVFLCGLCEYGVSALRGRLWPDALPLHLCGMMFLLTPLHALTDGARPSSFAARLHGFLGAVVFHPGVPGVWAALLFPDWLELPFRDLQSVSGFFAHGLVSVYGAAVLVRIAKAEDGRALFRRDLRSSALFMGLGAPVMYLFDRAAGTNFWFMAGPSVGSPFAGAYARGGYGGYLLAFLLTAAAGTALWYGLRYLFLVRGRRRGPRA